MTTDRRTTRQDRKTGAQGLSVAAPREAHQQARIILGERPVAICPLPTDRYFRREAYDGDLGRAATRCCQVKRTALPRAPPAGSVEKASRDHPSRSPPVADQAEHTKSKESYGGGFRNQCQRATSVDSRNCGAAQFRRKRDLTAAPQ